MAPVDLYDGLSRVRPPLQDRSRRALHAALDAFESLLVERPFARVTMQDVADRADLSITSVYARFEGKDALVLALHERVIDEALSQMDVQLRGADLAAIPVEELVAGLVGRALAFAQAHAHVFRAVLAAADDETNERAAAFIRAGSERVAAVLAPHLATPDAQARRDVDFAWRSIVAVLQQLWALGGVDPSRYPLTSVELTDRLTRQFLAAVGHPGDLRGGPRR